MNSVPDGVIHHILSQLRDARDIASCESVSTLWKDVVPFIPTLYFPRNAFENVPIAHADATIGRMIETSARLQELVIYCPFSVAALASWLDRLSHTLRILELRMDSACDKGDAVPDLTSRVDCIDAAKGIEALKLWGVSMMRAPTWGVFVRLHSLEIVGAKLGDEALKGIVQACPCLTDLALLGCDGVTSVAIELQHLERCRLDFLVPGNCSLFLSAPRLEVLEIQGFSWVHVHPNHRLRSICISKNSGSVNKIDFGKLAELEFLSLRGIQWTWGAVSSILQCASEVKHLVMKIEFCGDFETLQPFPETDFVEFFNNHPKLCRFEIHGAMFASLCHTNSLKNLDSKFVIPCLEEVVVTVRSPLNAEQKLSTLETLVKHSVRLRRMMIRISQMKNCHEAADQFFVEICRFQHMKSKIVQIQ